MHKLYTDIKYMPILHDVCVLKIINKRTHVTCFTSTAKCNYRQQHVRERELTTSKN